MRAALALISTAATFIAVSSATAAPTTAQELLNAYNLIVFGSVTSTSEVDGKAYIGGNAKGGMYNMHNVNQGAGLPSLAVGGDVKGSVQTKGLGAAIGGNLTAGSSFISNDGGNAYVGGNWTGNATFNQNGNGNVFLGGTKTGNGNVNGGTLFQNQSSPAFLSNIPTAATTSAIQNTLTSYSSWLDTLSANSNVTVANNVATFTAAPGANGIAVFDINNAIAFFNSFAAIEFNLNGAKQLIINVSGAFSNLLEISESFNGGSASARALDTIWNFTDATNIKIGAQFGGSILAVLADVTLNGNEEGTLVSKGLIQNSEIHYVNPNNNIPNQPPEAPGQTPLPASFSLFIAGLGTLGLLARRRKKKAAQA